MYSRTYCICKTYSNTYIYKYTYQPIYYIIVRNLCRGVKTHKLIIIVLATGVSITDRKLGVTGEDVTFPQTHK